MHTPMLTHAHSDAHTGTRTLTALMHTDGCTQARTDACTNADTDTGAQARTDSDNDAGTQACMITDNDVFGDGDSYKDRNPSLPEWLIGRKPPATPIKALTWSVDSFQLASLDAASTLRVWWMRPEYGMSMPECCNQDVRKPACEDMQCVQNT
eukprot:1152317-Pelagomonas_calceolata.AAC.1